MDLGTLQAKIRNKLNLYSPRTIINKYPLFKIDKKTFLLSKNNIFEKTEDVELFYLALLHIYGGHRLNNLLDTFENSTIYFKFNDDDLIGGLYDCRKNIPLTRTLIVSRQSPLNAIKDCTYIYSVEDDFYKKIKTLCSWQYFFINL